jgi:hypothetical protein
MDWIILILIVFVPRLFNLDVFLTADEVLFFNHARDFAAGMVSGDFSQTLGIGYPGVTVAAWSAPAVYGATTISPLTRRVELLPPWSPGCYCCRCNLSRSLLGRWPALWGVGLLALDPQVLAHSRLIHNEAPLALFMTLAGLSCLLWLDNALSSPPEKNRGIIQRHPWRWLLLAGIFTGLALLTKSTAVLLGPMLVALVAG